MQARGSEVQHVSVQGTPANSLLSSACQSTVGTLDFAMTVPPSCKLLLKLYFASPDSALAQPVGVFIDDMKVGTDYDIALAGTGALPCRSPAREPRTVECPIVEGKLMCTVYN
jgi:hypothetical protein